VCAKLSIIINNSRSYSVNEMGMNFAAIRSGSFTMGSPGSESGRYDDEKPHTVTLTNDFEMQTTEVTQKQWFNVMGSVPSSFKGQANCATSYDAVNKLCPNHPVENVSHDDIQGFLTKLNQTNRDGYTYRLPTEAEWEYAARAGTQTAYSFGNDTSQMNSYAWHIGNSGLQTHDVAQLKANAFGLYDMHGNVWEWVSDWNGDYASSGPVTDPVGLLSGYYRSVRGGGWDNDARVLRSAYRNDFGPAILYSTLGFRLVRTKNK
jgi:formylglycine-generating enzyme required for sulfatase activity